jgi:hypothetical protein
MTLYDKFGCILKVNFSVLKENQEIGRNPSKTFWLNLGKKFFCLAKHVFSSGIRVFSVTK